MGKETDSIFTGKYSFTNFVRSKGKKNDEDPNSDKKDVQNPDEDPNSDKKDVQNPEKKDDQDHGESSVEYDEHLDELLKKFKNVAVAKNQLDMFDRLSPSLEIAYKQCQNKGYKLLAKDDREKKLAGAVINFIAGKKICETNLAVTGVELDASSYCNFLVKCGDTSVLLSRSGGYFAPLVVVFGEDCIVRFEDH